MARTGMLVTTSAFKEWAEDAPVGDCLTYYVGNLAVDREIPGTTGFFLKRLANAALENEEWGKVTLYQKRLGAGSYAYVAKRINTPTMSETVQAVVRANKEAAYVQRHGRPFEGAVMPRGL